MAATNLALIDHFATRTRHFDIGPAADRLMLQQQAAKYLCGNVCQLPHAKPISPFGVVTINRAPRHENYDVESSVTATPSGRTNPEKAPIDGMCERELAGIVMRALHQHYGELKASIKRVANDAGSSIDAAKNWWQGISPPSSIFLARLEAKVPALAAEMRRLRAMEAEIDPNFQREMLQLLQRFSAR